MRLAILADIHGNLPALEAVCAELERLQPDAVIVDGDLINAVPFSPQVIDRVVARVRTQNWIVVRGNHEFYYLDFGTPRAPDGHEDPERWGQLHWLVERITPAQGAFLAALPDDLTLYFHDTQPLRVAHGVPGNNRTGFYTRQPAAQIAAKIGHVEQSTLISAHTHVRIDRHIALDVDPADDPYLDPHLGSYEEPPAAIHRGWHLVNPGSVGLPLNADPRASFAVVESVPESHTPGGWACTHHCIDYDRRPALAAYADSGMMAAGGVISTLFYWELVTAEPEIIFFHQWARANHYDPEIDIRTAFAAYAAATGRGEYVRERDPLG